jgi:F-type H+-transporting ATPase subunit b
MANVIMVLASVSPDMAVPLLASSGGGGAVNVDFDALFVVQMLMFIALVVFLKPLLFDPVLKVFEERERRTDGAREEARQMQRQAGELLVKYESELRRIGEVAAQERDRIRAETSKLEAQILTEAREATSRIIDHGRGQIAEQVERIRFDLGKRSELLARDIASQALGRSVQ